MDIPAVLLPTNCIPEEYIYMESCPCPCGAVGYKMVEQGLSTRPNGAMWDVITARCSTCDAEQTFCFDVSQCLGKTVPEKPSQLFDLVEWMMILFHLMHLPPTENEKLDLIIRTRTWVAVEQALLFFDEGAETPRADAFFHSPGGPPLRIQHLSKRFLVPMQARMRADMGWPPDTSKKDVTFLRTNDGKLYHSECLPGDAEYPVQFVVADMIPTESICARCGLSLSDP